jgi:hypothetical protein
MGWATFAILGLNSKKLWIQIHIRYSDVHYMFTEFLQNLAIVSVDLEQNPEQKLSELYRQELPVQLKSIRVECRNWVASSFR